MPTNLELPMITLYPTNKCGFSCRYCPRESLDERTKNFEMPASLIELIMSSGIELGYERFKFSSRWGDPLQHDSIPSLVAKAKRLGYKEVTLVTNGPLLSKKLSSIAEAGLDRMCISLDTIRPATFKMLCGVGSLEEIKDVIAKTAGIMPNTKINMVLMKGLNDGQLEEMIEYATSIGAILQVMELVNRNKEFSGRHFLSLDPIIEYYKGRAELYSEDRIESRTSIHFGKTRLEFRQSRKWSSFTPGEKRMLVHPDGTIGFWNNDRTIHTISDCKDVESCILRMRESFVHSIDYDEIKNIAKNGTMAKVS